VQALEGRGELKSERRRCGDGQGCCSPFIGVEGELGKGGQGDNGWPKGLNAIDGWVGERGGLRRGIKEGHD
jgi:hypothetical protein